MANLQNHRAHESLNADSAATWEEQSALTVSNTASVVDVSGYHTIHLQTDNDLNFTFVNTSTDVLDTSTCLYLKGGDTIYSLKIPHGLGNNVHFQIERKTSTNCGVAFVLA